MGALARTEAYAELISTVLQILGAVGPAGALGIALFALLVGGAGEEERSVHLLCATTVLLVVLLMASA